MSVTVTELTNRDDIGTLVRPDDEPTVGIVIAHGGTDDGRRFFVDEARMFAERGAAVLLPVTRLPQHGDIAASEAATWRAVRTYRWALDVLSGHVSRLGFYGHSGGAFTGALLASADDRLDGIVLAGIGCGTVVRHARADLVRSGHPDPEPYLTALERFEPHHHVADRYPSRLFVQYGRHDDAVRPEEARALHAAAGPGTCWTEYDCGHAIPADPLARWDRMAFFGL